MTDTGTPHPHGWRVPSALAQTLFASAMATPLTHAVALEATGRASQARASLLAGRFDQAPVTDRGKVVGWARTSHLNSRGSVGTAMIPLSDTALVATTTPLADVLPLVVSTGFVFLAGSSGLAAFTVPSDLDRLAVRTYLYMLFADLEIVLGRLVRQWVSEQVILESVRDEQRERYRQAQKKGRETDAVEYLYLADYAAIAGQSPHFAEMFGCSLKKFNRDLGSLNELRTCIAHPTKSITGSFEPSDVVARAALAESLLVRLTRLAPEF